MCGFLDDYPGTVQLLAELLRPGGIFVQWDWEREDADGDGLSRGEIDDALLEADRVQVLRVADDRDDESLRCVDGDTEPDPVVVDDLAGVRVDGGVEHRVITEGTHGRMCHEGERRDRDSVHRFVG